MKKIYILIGCLSFLFACANNMIALKYMGMTRPNGWEIKNINPNTVEFRKVINGAPCLMSIHSFKPSKNLSLEEKWNEMKPILTRGNVVISEKKEKIGEIEWMTLEFEHKCKYNSYSYTVHDLYLFTIKNGIRYSSIFTAIDKNYDLVLPDFMKLINDAKLNN